MGGIFECLEFIFIMVFEFYTLKLKKNRKEYLTN